MSGLALFRQQRLAKSRRRLLAINIVLYWVLAAGLCSSGSVLGVVLVMLPYLHGILQARNQYEWHGLVNPESPFEVMGNTTLWISSSGLWDALVAGVEDDQLPLGDPPRDWTYYDNFHLLHHLYPSAHFDEYLQLLRSRAQEIQEAGAAVLRLDGLQSIIMMMWTRDIEQIADLAVTDEFGRVEGGVEALLQPVGSMAHNLLPFFESPPVLRVESVLTRAAALTLGSQR